MRLLKIWIWIIILVLFCWITSFNIVANAYHTHVFPLIAQIKSVIFSHIPFSIGDILWPILILLVIFGIMKIFRRKVKWPYKLSQLVFWFLIIYTFFEINWAINYHKSPLSSKVQKVEWTKEKLAQLNQIVIDSLNQLARDRKAITIHDINNHLEGEYSKYLGEIGAAVTVKYSLWSFLINRMQTSGYYNPLTGEAQIVNDLPDCMYPYLSAHEMAHQVGIAAEDDANFMAYIICVLSPEKSYRYSAYLNLYLYTRSELFYLDSSSLRKGYAQLDTIVKSDLQLLKNRAQKYRGKLGKTSMQLYNEYLKMNGLPKGIDTYDEVTRWVYEWEKERRPKIKL